MMCYAEVTRFIPNVHRPIVMFIVRYRCGTSMCCGCIVCTGSVICFDADPKMGDDGGIL